MEKVQFTVSINRVLRRLTGTVVRKTFYHGRYVYLVSAYIDGNEQFLDLEKRQLTFL